MKKNPLILPFVGCAFIPYIRSSMTRIFLYHLIPYILVIISFPANSQIINANDFRKVLKASGSISEKTEAYVSYMKSFDSYDSVVHYGEEALQFAEKEKSNYSKARIYQMISILSAERGKFEESFQWGVKAVSAGKAAANDSLTAKSYLIIAAVNYEMANYDKAAGYCHESLKYSEKNSYLKLMANAYNQLGLTHGTKKSRDYEMALKYYKKAEKLCLETSSLRDLGFVWLRMGAAYSATQQIDKAEIYLGKALRLADSANIVTVQKWTLEAYSNLFRSQKKYNQALPILFRSLKLSKQERQWSGIISSQSGIAELYSVMGDHKKALMYSDSAMKNCLDNKVFSFLSIVYGGRSLIYERAKDYHNALKWYRKEIRVKDSLFKKQSSDNMNELETKYETGKKEKELLEKKSELLVQRADNERQQTQRNFFIGGSVLLLGFLIFTIMGYRQKQKDNLVIAAQKKEVEDQKQIIEEKQKEVMDSINYAKRIQQAHMPNDNYVMKKMTELRNKKTK